AIRLHHNIVGAVEALALIALGQGCALTVGGDAADLTTAVLGGDDQPLPVESQAVGLAPAVGSDLRSLDQLPPPHDAVVPNIAEEQLIAMPDWALGKGKAAGYPLYSGSFCYQLVKRRAPHVEGLWHALLGSLRWIVVSR